MFKMRLSNIFFILAGIWTIDFFITILALNYFGLYEMNIISSKLYTLGVIGYILTFVLNCLFLFGISYIIHYISKKESNKYKKLNIYLPLSIFVVIEVIVIIHNGLLCWSVR